jgi:hypothetical protein
VNTIFFQEELPMEANAANETRLPLNEVEHVQRETKEEAFARLAVPRVNRALDAIRLIANLGNRSAYGWSAEDQRAIFATLRQALDDAESKFRSNSPRVDFQLKR